MKVLVFDIRGQYAHFKKIYATTSAISYAIPPKTTLYGYIGAMLGLEKINNAYLDCFSNKQCLLSVGLRKPIVMQRLNINLRPNIKGTMSESENRKPTTMEFVYSPEYRIYFAHEDRAVYAALKEKLENQTCVYTPSLGIASCISNFEYVGEFDTQKTTIPEPVNIHSVIPKTVFKRFDNQLMHEAQNEVVEQSMYAVEMDRYRNVTEREDMLFDRKGQAVSLFVDYFYPVGNENVIFF